MRTKVHVAMLRSSSASSKNLRHIVRPIVELFFPHASLATRSQAKIARRRRDNATQKLVYTQAGAPPMLAHSGAADTAHTDRRSNVMFCLKLKKPYVQIAYRYLLGRDLLSVHRAVLAS